MNGGMAPGIAPHTGQQMGQEIPAAGPHPHATPGVPPPRCAAGGIHLRVGHDDVPFSERQRVSDLADMGPGVIPMLAEALDDASPTKTVPPRPWYAGSPPPLRVWNVNQLVALAIIEITDHYEFEIGGPHHYLRLDGAMDGARERLPEFRELVLAWYAANKNRTVEERYLAELGDTNEQNRHVARWWLGEHKVPVAKAVPVLTQRIDAIVDTGGRDIPGLGTREIGAICTALTEISGKKAYRAVRKAYGFLLRRGDLRDIEAGFKAMDLVDHKAEAETELKQAQAGDPARFQRLYEEGERWRRDGQDWPWMFRHNIEEAGRRLLEQQRAKKEEKR